MKTSQKNRFIFFSGKLSVKSFTFLICDTLSIKQIKKQMLNYINKSNILHNYVQNDFLVASFISRVQFSINMFIIYDKGELNIILSWMIFASTVSSHSYCTAKINLFFKRISYFICDLIGTLYHSFPSHTNSGTLVWRRTGCCCHHSRRTQTACIPLSEGGSTTAEHSLNRPPLTSAPGSGLLQKLHERWK